MRERMREELYLGGVVLKNRPLFKVRAVMGCFTNTWKKHNCE